MCYEDDEDSDCWCCFIFIGVCALVCALVIGSIVVAAKHAKQQQVEQKAEAE